MNIINKTNISLKKNIISAKHFDVNYSEQYSYSSIVIEAIQDKFTIKSLINNRVFEKLELDSEINIEHIINSFISNAKNELNLISTSKLFNSFIVSEDEVDFIRCVNNYNESKRKILCYNKTLFHEMLRKEIDTYKRNHLPFSILLLDLCTEENCYQKYFDQSNQILFDLCEVLNKNTRSIDLLFHISEFKFAIILHKSWYIDSLIVSDRINKKFQLSDMKHKHNLKRSLNIGIITFSQDSRQFDLDNINEIIISVEKVLKLSKILRKVE